MTLLPHPQAPASKRELYTVFAGLMLALTLASLDQNIVSTALPRIVSDLGGLAHLSWVVTAFMVTSTISTPLYGKLSDMCMGASRSFSRRSPFSSSVRSRAAKPESSASVRSASRPVRFPSMIRWDRR